MKKYLYLVALLVAISPSCKQADSPISSIEEQTQLPKHNVNINLSGTFSNSEGDVLRAYMTPTDKDGIKITFDESELMKDGTEIDPATGKPKRVKNTNTAQLTLYFVEKSNLNNVQTAIVDPTDFRKNDDGSYTIEFSGTVALSGNFDAGEWYVSGGYRLQNGESVVPVGSTYVTDDGKIEAFNGEMTVKDFKMPFVFGWTQLSTKSSNASLKSNHAQQFALNFKPDGHMLRYRVINNLVEDIKLGVVNLYSEGLSLGSGPFVYTSPSTDNFATGNLPRISVQLNAANSKRNAVSGFGPTNELSRGWGEGRVLAAGEYITNYIRFNNPGNPTAKDASFMRFQFGTLHFPQGETARGDKLDQRDIVDMPVPQLSRYFQGDKRLPLQPSGYILDLWRGGSLQDYVGYNKSPQDADRHTLGLRNMFLPKDLVLGKKGAVNNINYKINSDLMITELYTTQYSERGGSFGLIEIYNPTLDPIDLSKYGLVRLGYRNDNGTYKVRNLPSATETAISINTGATLLPEMEKALVLPLDLRSGEPSGDWTINSFNRPIHQTLVEVAQYCYTQSIQYPAFSGSNTQYPDFSATVVDFSTKNHINGLKPIAPGATKIAPGKTVIVLFGGYAANNFQPNEEDKKIFAKIQAAVNAGYCDHVVAIAHGDSSAKPYEAKAGVTTADLGDGFSLVRIANVPNVERFGVNNGPTSYDRVKTRVFVDGTWNSLSFDGKNIVRKLIDGGAKALIRRPYGPYLWNTGFQDPDDPNRYYQKEYSVDKATFGAPYFSSYDADKTWSAVVKPRIDKRNANLFKKATK
ncbi:MAG: hypothetical protein SOW66_01400 [Porphyromonas sp.]|nr:hypothetical protein [Porphyromonas sp.]